LVCPSDTVYLPTETAAGSKNGARVLRRLLRVPQ